MCDPAEVRTEHLSNASVERYRCANPLGVCSHEYLDIGLVLRRCINFRIYVTQNEMQRNVVRKQQGKKASYPTGRSVHDAANWQRQGRGSLRWTCGDTAAPYNEIPVFYSILCILRRNLGKTTKTRCRKILPCWNSKQPETLPLY
jgi:hypothetical protein